MNFKIGLLALAGMIGIDSTSAAASYSAGPCMNTVWSNTENSGTELSCNANEVATTLLGIDGPTACKKGDIIVVNITTSIYFRASRYDFAIYTLTDNNGASDPIFGSECAVDILMRYFADQSVGAEQLCSLKPLTAFESWETPYTDLKECCTNKFSWDYQNCCSAEGLGGCGDPPPVERYFPTWQEGKLCQRKTNFEGWETTFTTLNDCCTSQFGYMYEACCQSDGMGGCA